MDSREIFLSKVMAATYTQELESRLYDFHYQSLSLVAHG